MEKKTCSLPAVVLVVLLSLGSALFAQTVNNINTVAGGGPNGLAATSSSIGLPWGVVQFGSGSTLRTYISDPLSNRVYQVDSANKLTVLAGNIVAGYFFDGAGATISSLNSPKGIAVDASGNVYIADSANNVVRVVNTQSTPLTIGSFLTVPVGAIATVAGNTNGQACATPPCGDGGSSLSAFLTNPTGVFLDGSGNIYIADTGDNVVREVNITTGNITLVAGNYTACATTPCGDGAAATAAQLNQPFGVGLDSAGNVYIADTSDFTIRVVNTQASTVTIQGVSIPAGDIATVAGNFTQCTVPPCGDTGSGTSAQLVSPRSVFVDGSGNIFLGDSQDVAGNILRKVSSGKINTIAGTYTQGFFGDGGSALTAELNTPTGVFVDGSNNVFIADTDNDVIREVSAGNINSTVGMIDVVNGVSIPQAAYSGDGALATDASLQQPSGVTSDAASNWFIADAANNRVRVVNNQTKTITVAGVSIPAGAIATIAGDGTLCNTGTCGDGNPPTQAQLSVPTAVSLDAKGNIYILDSEDSAVRVINTQTSAITIAGTVIQPGTLVTVAGNGVPGYIDNVLGTSAEFMFPVGMTLDSQGNIYVADGNPLGGPAPVNHVIRVVNVQTTAITIAGVSIQPGFVRTVAGTPQTACAVPTDPCGDGGAATSAQLNTPTGVAIDRSGNIFIADFFDNKIRKVNTSGIISTIAGTGAQCLSASCGDGGPATTALLFTPFDIAADYLGNVFIADSGDFVIRAVNTGTATITLGGVPIGAGDIAPVAGLGRFGFFGDGGPALSAEMAEPIGLGTDAAGDLLITDFLTWRVRNVNALLATAPMATPAPGSLTFPAQALNTVSAGKDVTLTNSANVTVLQISKIAISGDFAETNTCGASLPSHGSCKITVTFKPTATGARTGTLAITDSAGVQNVPLSGTAIATTDFTLGSTAANPASLSAGGSATSTITLTPIGGFNSATTLTCSVSPAPSLAPGCGLNPNQLTPSGSGAVQSTLTINTTAASAGLVTPDLGRKSMRFYAVWLLLPAMLLSGAGLSGPTRKRLAALSLVTMAVCGLLFLVGCGGGSSSSGGSTGTPAGTYTVTVTATAGTVTHQTQVTVTVQ